MNRLHRSGKTLGFVLGVALFVIVPLAASAAWNGVSLDRESIRENAEERIQMRTAVDSRLETSGNTQNENESSGQKLGVNASFIDLDKFPGKLCRSTITAAGISVPVFLPCKKDTPPPPVDVCPNVPGKQTSGPCADEVCEDGGGVWDGNSCEMPAEQDPTLQFSASPLAITVGSSSTLSWDSTDADTCTASGGWSGNKSLDGSQSVSPTATTTYTLMCENEDGDVTKSVTVNVVPVAPEPEVPTLTFSAAQGTISEGATTTLTWDSSNADECTASNGWSGNKSLDGTQVVSPTATTTYTLTCEGDGGEVAKSVTVNVIPTVEEPEDPTLSFTAAQSTINQGATTTLTWDSTDADSCTASNGWSGSKAVDGSQVVSPTATTTYTLTCENDEGEVAKSVTVNVILAPEPEGKLLITEVIYDLATGQGSEPANEWVEIYNGTDNAINLSNFSIQDASSTDALPDVQLPAGAYAVIIASSTTPDFWSIPGAAVIAQLTNTTIGNGLGNGGDMLALVSNAASTTVDAVSWGSNTAAFSPSVAGVDAGHSIARANVEVDTNSASDWVDRESPTPGQ